MAKKRLDVNEDGEFTVISPRLQKLGDDIKAVYLDLLSTKYEVTQRVSKKSDWIFYRAAELCERKDKGVVAFVSQQLEEMANAGNFWPQGLISEKMSFVADVESDKRNQVQLAKYMAQTNTILQMEKVYGRPVHMDMHLIQASPVVRAVAALRHKDKPFLKEIMEQVKVEIQHYWVANDLLKAALQCYR
jgi:hypothetical protein